MHNTCEDSLLATPIILDLVVLCELAQRIQIKRGNQEFENFDTVLSLLSYFLKAPLVPEGTPVVNALAAQRQVEIVSFAWLINVIVHRQPFSRMCWNASGGLYSVRTQGIILFWVCMRMITCTPLVAFSDPF